MPHLIFSQAGEVLFQVPLKKEQIKVGRSSQCDVLLTEPTISRLQLSIHQIEGSCFVKNLGKAKLKLNGKEIEAAPLSENDYLELENWKIALRKDKQKSENMEDTYVSDAGVRNTKILNLSREGNSLHYESVELKIETPGEASQTYPLSDSVITLGKAASCNVKLLDDFVSEVHAKLIPKDGKWIIYDLRSTNGTFVNGLRVGEAELKLDSVFQIGKTKIQLAKFAKETKISPMDTESFGPLVGKSSQMRELYTLMQQIAPTDFTVCVLGETGTGKELVARSLHELSPRKGKNYLAINCASFTKELIQSELFGHEKGAFTGAHQQYKGMFEQAEGGTLFLDEVGELPLEVQAMLLRVLETGKIRRVGGSQEIAVDVRVICATHRDLALMVKKKEFREDLFFRLHVLPLQIPALRNRKEDIPLLAKHFMKTLLPSDRKLSLSRSCKDFLTHYDWPGNVRELKNSMQRAMIFVRGEYLEPSDFGFLNLGEKQAHVLKEMDTLHKSGPSITPLQEVEMKYILQVLEENNHNKVATAQALGISKSSLYEKLRVYGVK